MTSILLADDHSIIRSGLALLISSMFPDALIDEAEDGDSAIEKIRNRQFDLVILDVNMPNTDPLGLISEIKAQHPSVKILMFSMNDEEVFAKRFLKAGALGYINKDAPQEEIQNAITTVLENKNYLSVSIRQKLAAKITDEDPGNPFDKLSTREFETLQHLLLGESVGTISEKMNLHTSTVGTHKARIFTKLGCSNVIELNTLAVKHNIVKG